MLLPSKRLRYGLCFKVFSTDLFKPVDAMQLSRRHIPVRVRARGAQAFTIVESVIALCVLMVFLVVSTASLNLFNNWAAKSRNAEAARSIVDDYVTCLLSDSVSAPAATAAGTDLDGDGVADGVACTQVGDRYIPGPTAASATGVVPLVVTRTTAPSAVVTGTLYWRVQAVGTSYGLSAATDLMQINFLIAYTYRNQTYYYKATTFKGSTN